MTEPQQQPVLDIPPEDTAPANVDESDAPALFTTIVMLGSIDLLEWLAPDQSTTRFDRFDATNAREYWLFRTLLDIQKAGTAMTRWQEFAAARKLRPEDGANTYDALALEALIAEQSLWQRRLVESLFRLICFASTNEPAYYEHLLRLTELEQLLYQQIEQRDYFGSESEFVRVEVARKIAEAQALASRAPLDRQRMRYVHDNFDRHVQRHRPPLLASAGSLARASLRNARPGEKRALGYCYRHSFSVPSAAIHFSPLPDERPHDHSRFRFGWLMVAFLAMAILTRAQELLAFQPKTSASWAARLSVEHAPKESPFENVAQVGDFVVVMPQGPERFFIAEVIAIHRSEFGNASYRVRYLDERPDASVEVDSVMPDLIHGYLAREGFADLVRAQLREAMKPSELEARERALDEMMADSDEAIRQAVLMTWSVGMRDHYHREAAKRRKARSG